jgi:hypothetical protein
MDSNKRGKDRELGLKYHRNLKTHGLRTKQAIKSNLLKEKGGGQGHLV